MLDVNITVQDGGIMQNNNADGVHIKIGASSKLESSYITILNTFSTAKIKEKLGDCPLADAVMDSIQAGCKKIYCYPVPPTTNGTISTVTETKSGTGSITVTGNPNNKYDFQIIITSTGAVNVGMFKFTRNHGLTWSDEITIPSDGEYEDATSGLTITFSASDTSFTEDDKFTFTTTAPAINITSITAIFDKIKNLNIEFEFIHLVGETNKAIWTSLASEASTLDTTYKKPCFVICEATAKTSEQTVDTYVTALLADRRGFSSKYIQVVATHVLLTKMDGTEKDVNLAALICGLYARAQIQQSIGEVKSFPINFQKLLPEGIEDKLEDLDDAKFVTARQYIGLYNYYITNAHMMVDNTDYKYAEILRVANKLKKDTRKQALLALQTQIDTSNIERSLTLIAEDIKIPMENMIEKKQIATGQIIIPENQDVFTDTIDFIIRYTPVGYAKSIDISMGITR